MSGFAVTCGAIVGPVLRGVLVDALTLSAGAQFILRVPVLRFRFEFVLLVRVELPCVRVVRPCVWVNGETGWVEDQRVW